MGMKSEGETITCDCGFSFQRGQSGKHECADGLRAKLAAAVRREEGLKASVDVLGRANAAQDDHINQQQARIDTLENKNADLGKYVGKLEQRLQPLNFETSAEEFLAHCLKAEEISGDKQQTRIKELIGWFSRYYQHAANPKWLSGHVAELCYFIIKNAQAEQQLQQPIKLPDCVLVLLNHIEDVVDEYNWVRISVEKWNAVTMLSRDKVEGE